MKPIQHLFPLVVLFAFTIGCTKDDNRGPEIPRDKGTFTALVDGKQVDFPGHSAVYDTKGHSIYFEAKDYDYEIRTAFYNDSLQPLKKYIFEPNSINSAIIYNSSITYVTSGNDPGAGGAVTITKLDLVNKLISGKIDMKYIAENRTQNLSLTNGIFTDIPLSLDTTDFINNQLECTVTGINSTIWQYKFLYPYVSCISSGTKKEIEFTARPLNTQIHELDFNIPLSLGPGIYTVDRFEPPNTYCGSGKITTRYGSSSNNYKYMPTSGSFEILESDVPNKKFKAKFNIIFTNINNPSETIRFGNGVITLVDWRDL